MEQKTQRQGNVENLFVTYSMNDLAELRHSAQRLERYSLRVKAGIWRGDRDGLVAALADVAEAGEIARRCYLAIREYLNEE
jgi:hypothetical protein